VLVLDDALLHGRLLRGRRAPAHERGAPFRVFSPFARACEAIELQKRYRGALGWDDDAARLAASHEGRTGFPLVDAGMRQLRASGWMHNRVRLVVGSFLTQDLYLDRRLGEAWFARLLLDGEPAQSTGNRQWIASVGADPAPAYRRLYNPARHQERFDREGLYVRRWVPQLGAVPAARLADPGR
jgi:deoxyribodipyrimidine photo-lyase